MEFKHPYKECRHGTDCHAFERIQKGGGRSDDRSHLALWFHKHQPENNA